MSTLTGGGGGGLWWVWVVTLHQVGWLVTGGGWRLARRGGGLCCTIDLSSISNVHSINIAATTHPSAKTRAKQSQIELVNAMCLFSAVFFILPPPAVSTPC